MSKMYSISKGKATEKDVAFCMIISSLSQTADEKLQLPVSLRFRDRGEKFRVPKSDFLPLVECIMELVMQAFTSMDKTSEMLKVRCKNY